VHLPLSNLKSSVIAGTIIRHGWWQNGNSISSQTSFINSTQSHSTIQIMDGSKDDFKWFGEGFDGFPKRLPEDCVEYMLFIIDSQLTPKEVLARLEAVGKEAVMLTRDLLKDYIWQRDDFTLKLEQSNGKLFGGVKGER
jgi:hypothetical protein